MSDQKPQILRSVLTQQVQEGMKKIALAEFYGVSSNRMAKILKHWNLKIRKFHVDKFELVDDMTESVESTETGVEQEPLNEEEVGENRTQGGW